MHAADVCRSGKQLRSFWAPAGVLRWCGLPGTWQQRRLHEELPLKCLKPMRTRCRSTAGSALRAGLPLQNHIQQTSLQSCKHLGRTNAQSRGNLCDGMSLVSIPAAHILPCSCQKISSLRTQGSGFKNVKYQDLSLAVHQCCFMLAPTLQLPLM